MRVIVFDIWGDYAHFRKFYTTTSPLTFDFPPPPTVWGMLGAILGKDKQEYLKIFNSEKTNVAIRLMKPVKKIRMGVNLVNTKGSIWWLEDRKEGARTPIRFELLKNPRYRIYISHSEETIMEDLLDSLQNHKTFYTLSLGLSEFIADFQFIGALEGEETQGRKAEFFTVLPLRKIQLEDFYLDEGRKYLRERIPISMKDNREVDQYDDVIYEAEGRSISASPLSYLILENGEAICFL